MIDIERKEYITKIIESELFYTFTDEIGNKVVESLNALLNSKEYEYTFKLSNPDFKEDTDFDFLISRFNERTSNRKRSGTYYTPQDVSDYIALNTIIMSIKDENNNTYNIPKGIKYLTGLATDDLDYILYKTKVFDPTSGAGEFLLSASNLKLSLLEKKNILSDENILNVAKTIYGNDINSESVDVSKYRLFLNFAKKLENPNSYKKLANILKNNIMNYDMIYYNGEIKDKFDVIIGNPPYVEYRNYKTERLKNNKFGNVYADVVVNSIELLKKDGGMGYVLPLSYVSTLRMRMLREYIIEDFSTQFVLNFADRPDCLFPGVHQKLNILIAKKGKAEHKLYTSSYRHWRKNERESLLNGCEIKKVFNYTTEYLPKLGNKIEESIYRKVKTVKDKNILNNQVENGKEVYINMRATFWIKAFSFNPGSREYKEFIFPEELNGFFISLLNSTLFWFFWTVVSDGWHITNKELKEFYVPKNIDNLKKFNELSKMLEEKLELTKKKINSRQTMYEYKHRDCKDVIDLIDDELAKLYELSKDELEYIKSYNISYRTGGSK